MEKKLYGISEAPLIVSVEIHFYLDLIMHGSCRIQLSESTINVIHMFEKKIELWDNSLNKQNLLLTGRHLTNNTFASQSHTGSIYITYIHFEFSGQYICLEDTVEKWMLEKHTYCLKFGKRKTLLRKDLSVSYVKFLFGKYGW
jgi:hypothetical protein